MLLLVVSRWMIVDAAPFPVMATLCITVRESCAESSSRVIAPFAEGAKAMLLWSPNAGGFAFDALIA